MTRLIATTRLRCPDADGLSRILAEHLAGHGADACRECERQWSIRDRNGEATLRAGADGLHVETAAADAEALAEMQYILASHIGEFTREAPVDILWSGDGSEVATLPNLRRMRVEAVRDLTPAMRRITFSGARLRRFETLSALHAKLLLPNGEGRLRLPFLTPAGVIDWGPESARPVLRKYTIRHVRPDRGTMDVDFVLHGDGAPGSRFAMQARPGDEIGLLGPGGGSAGPADWTLYAGDETALPAIARLAESLPRGARGLALIEIANPAEEQPIETKGDIDIVWLHRDGRAKGKMLAEHVSRLDCPKPDSFAWAGCEFSAFRAIRALWRKNWRIARDRHLAVSYWRDGLAQT